MAAVQEMDNLRYKITDTLRESDVQEKALHHEHIKRLEKLFNELEEVHRMSAYKATIAIVASAIGIVGAGFDDKSKPGKILGAISALGGKTNDFLQQMDQTDKKRLEGQIELLRQELQDGNKTDEHIIQRLREIDRIFDELRNKVDQTFERAFR